MHFCALEKMKKVAQNMEIIIPGLPYGKLERQQKQAESNNLASEVKLDSQDKHEPARTSKDFDD